MCFNSIKIVKQIFEWQFIQPKRSCVCFVCELLIHRNCFILPPKMRISWMKCDISNVIDRNVFWKSRISNINIRMANLCKHPYIKLITYSLSKALNQKSGIFFLHKNEFLFDLKGQNLLKHRPECRFEYKNSILFCSSNKTKNLFFSFRAVHDSLNASHIHRHRRKKSSISGIEL